MPEDGKTSEAIDSDQCRHKEVLKKFRERGHYFEEENDFSGIPDTRGDSASIFIRGDCGIEELEAFLYFLKKDHSTPKELPSYEKISDRLWLVRSLDGVRELTGACIDDYAGKGYLVSVTRAIDTLPSYVRLIPTTSASGDHARLRLETVHDVHAASSEAVNQTRLNQIGE